MKCSAYIRTKGEKPMRTAQYGKDKFSVIVFLRLITHGGENTGNEMFLVNSIKSETALSKITISGLTSYYTREGHQLYLTPKECIDTILNNYVVIKGDFNIGERSTLTVNDISLTEV